MLTEHVGKWEYPQSIGKLQWNNDILTAKELHYPKEVIRQLEDEPDPHRRQRILHDARHKM